MKQFCKHGHDTFICGRTKHHECYGCVKVYRSQHRKYNLTKARADQLRFHFKLSIEAYEEMLQAQNYRCAACKRHISQLDRALCVDHDHSCCPTSKTCGNCIRGLLCFTCNMALGLVNDNSKVLEDLVAYVTSKQTLKGQSVEK